MEQIMKVYLAIFLLLLLLFSAGGIFKLYVDVANAQDFTSNLIHEMECSDFDTAIVRDSFSRASELDYTLAMELYQTDGSSMSIEDGGQLPSDLHKVYLARVELTYPLTLSLFDLRKEQSVFGYAR